MKTAKNETKRDTVDLNKDEQKMFDELMKTSKARQRIDLYRQLIREKYLEIKKEVK